VAQLCRAESESAEMKILQKVKSAEMRFCRNEIFSLFFFSFMYFSVLERKKKNPWERSICRKVGVVCKKVGRGL